MNKIGCVILAAGEGTRMKSDMPKVLFDICGKPMIEHLFETVCELKKVNKIYLVIGHKAEQLKTAVLNFENISRYKNRLIFVKQHIQKGSADALMQVKDYIDKNTEYLLVLAGDVPLISKETLEKLSEKHIEEKVECSVLSVIMNNPFGYGRIIRDMSKRFIDIIEELDANEEQKKIKEVNSGIYIFNTKNLWNALKKVKPNNKKKEYYLTDVVRYLSNKIAVLTDKPEEVRGINTRKDLLEVTEIVRYKILEGLMLKGISIVLPETVFIDLKTKISQNTQILPGTVIYNSEIGSNCIIGPYSYLNNTRVANSSNILYSYITDTVIGENCKIGPFSRIINNTEISSNVIIGNFAEITRSKIGEYTKIRHHSYVGDCEIDRRVNIGAGSITCNYDGLQKNKTSIGRNVFIGSNVNLVAPIKIGKNVVIAAGSTVTKDVPDNSLVIARAQEVFKKDHRIIKKLFNKKG